MTPTKWLTSLGILGLLLAGAALFFTRAERPVESAPAVKTAAVTAAPPAPVLAPDKQDFKSGPPMKRVMDLYAAESKRVGNIDPDPKATQARLEVDARELTPEEIRWLAAQATDIKNDADARFFSAYLIGLSHQEVSITVLGAIAVSPVPVSKNDRFVEQERAFRASAVEGISHACKEFPVAAKDQLLNVVSRQSDEFISDRAHRGLYACQKGTTIESQDTEALEKFRQQQK